MPKAAPQSASVLTPAAEGGSFAAVRADTTEELSPWMAGGNRALAALLGTIHVQRKIRVGQQEGQTLRRSPLDGGTSEAAPAESAAATERAPEERGDTSSPAPAEERPSGRGAEHGLIVDDEAQDVGDGQMRKSEFLAQLREAVCASANEGMAETGQTTDACPWIDYWFAHAAGKNAGYVEKGIRKFAPESETASTAAELIAVAAARVRQRVDHWAKTGEIGELPEGFTPELPGMGLLGSVAGMFFKTRPGGARDASDPNTIRAELGPGHPLSGDTRSRMEAAFGLSFSRVRLHTDSHAASVSDRFNARAFAIGEHVAFGAGEYKPGTLIGDALIAHELAHVVQQGAARDATPQQKGSDASSDLERDADLAAAGVVSNLVTGKADAQPTPRLRSGLQLSRCGGQRPAERPTLPFGPSQADRGNTCTGSPIRIEIRKSRDLSATFQRRAMDAMVASSGVSFMVPLNSTSLTVGEEMEALLVWSCPNGPSGTERATWTHDWTRAGEDDLPPAVGGRERIGVDAHGYGLSAGAGHTAREAAESKGFNTETCTWEFTENFRGTPTLRAGEQVLKACVYGFQFQSSSRPSGQGPPQRSASVRYWGVDSETEIESPFK